MRFVHLREGSQGTCRAYISPESAMASYSIIKLNVWSRARSSLILLSAATTTSILFSANTSLICRSILLFLHTVLLEAHPSLNRASFSGWLFIHTYSGHIEDRIWRRRRGLWFLGSRRRKPDALCQSAKVCHVSAAIVCVFTPAVNWAMNQATPYRVGERNSLHVQDARLPYTVFVFGFFYRNDRYLIICLEQDLSKIALAWA